MTFSPKLARIVRRALLTIAVLATVGLLAVLVENCRGDRAWAAYAAKATAAGARLDAFPAPSRLPAERNFMKTPVVDRWLWAKGNETGRTQFFNDLGSPMVPWRKMWQEGRRFDPSVVVYGRSGHADGTEMAAVPSEAVISAVLDELRQAAVERADSELQRPAAISMENSAAAPIPAFQVARTLVMVIGIDACQTLAENRGDAAFADVLAGLKLARGFSQAPDAMLLEAMIGCVLAEAALHPVWEGIDRAAWSDGQLRQLQHELSMSDPVAGLERALESERTGFVAVLDQVPAGQSWFRGGGYLGYRERWHWTRLVPMPRGWVQQNKVVACEGIVPAIEAVAARGTPDFLARREEVSRHARHFGETTTPYNFLALLVEPAFAKVTDHAVRVGNTLRLAQVACAIERHRLAHGAAPESLAELVPDYLTSVPRDLIDGQPLRYRRVADGGFVLYSVGTDGRDDGGTPVDPGSRDVNPVGDWCWPRAVPTP